MSALIEQYKAKAPPSPQIIEAYVQRIANYMNLFTEDSHYASKDPTARDSALGAIQQNPQMANDFSPYSVVPLGSDPDPYLAKADAEIERISSKSTLTMAEYVPPVTCPHVLSLMRVLLMQSRPPLALGLLRSACLHRVQGLPRLCRLAPCFRQDRHAS